MTNGITTTTTGHVCTIEIDNRDKRNALTPGHVEELTATFERLADGDDVRAVVLRGAGEEAFCSGYDISQLSGGSGARGPRIEAMANAIYEFPYPTIAMVHGYAIGAGYLLATACDLRIAGDDARFGVPSARLGVVYTARGLELSIEVVGTAATKEVLFTAEQFDADRAREMGLVNRVYPRPELQAETMALAETVASGAPLSQKGTKQIIHAITDGPSLTDAEQEWVRGLRAEAHESRDHEEGKRAFAEDRDPEFEGR